MTTILTILWAGACAGEAGTGARGVDGPEGGGGRAVGAGGNAGSGGGGRQGGPDGNGGSGAGGGSGGRPDGAAGAAGTLIGGRDGGAGAPGADAGGGNGASVIVHLVPRAGVTGMQRVNFAVPLGSGQLTDPARARVLMAGAEVRSARRAVGKHRDGSMRSLQVQIDVVTPGERDVEVRLGEAPMMADLTLAAVETTLDPADGKAGPRVWALLPARWLSASGVAGPQVAEADVAGTPLDAWKNVCNYPRHTVSSFLTMMSDPAVWLFDRATAFYRGYARRGDLVTLETAYREAAIYRAGITGLGAATRIGVPGKADDLKYHYGQSMAIHYLLTGDDRFREATEAVAARTAALWTSPGYAGGSDFWTERHAGFALLTYVWAEIVSDDRSAEFAMLADAAVTAYLDLQTKYPVGYADQEARCFAHSASAHGEGYGYFGCSPWMSAILADGLDGYAALRSGAQQTAARTSLVKLGRMIARDGRDGTGKPFYWMGVGTTSDEIDDDNEHWGESAYIVAMAWHHGGRTDAALRTAAMQLVAGTMSKGTAPHMRSFNWQCLSAVATPYYLR